MASMTAAPAPLEFADGTKYRISPLTDKDIEELDMWVQSRVIENARNSITPNMSVAERAETLEIAMKLSLSVSFTSDIGAKMIATVPGMTRLVWQSIRKNHPEVTESELRKHMLNEDNIREANIKFSKVNNSPRKGQRQPPKRQKARR
jgi:hypothetical protein